ncbi:MAG: DUF58 domain-containing protein, partial [Dehalococcoidia bacterium]|nr:DUF58 domain-containing protein [Dehalococcoidia bacterium]
YQFGDDVRRIDWNVTARTTRVHVRQYIEEREITAWLLVDCSPSIHFGTSEQSKHDIVTQFAGLAAQIYARHGNNVGLLGFSHTVEMVVPPRTGRLQTLRIIHALQEHFARAAHRAETDTPRGDVTDLTATLERAIRVIKRRSLIFLVSDFLTPPGWERPLRHLTQRHDVIAVRVVDPREQELPDVGLLRMEDPETGEQIWIDTSHRPTRERFRIAARERERALAQTLAAANVDLLTLSTAEGIVTPLLRFASLRKRRRLGSSPGRGCCGRGGQSRC